MSFVLPTRSRPDSLRRTVDSMISQSAAPGTWELYVITDMDDPDSAAAAVELRRTYATVNLRLLTRPRSASLSDDYYNWVFCGRAPATPTGDIFGILGDDVGFVTQNWDTLAITTLDALATCWPDRLFAAYPQDLHSENKPEIGVRNWGWFPLVTREAVILLGWFMPPALPTWGADTALAKIYAAAGRYVLLPYTLDHISYHSYGNLRPDEIGASMSRRFNSHEERELRRNWNSRDFPAAIDKLGGAINARMG